MRTSSSAWTIRITSSEKSKHIDSLSFQKLFEEFLAYKRSALTQKQYSNYCTDFPIFLHFIGNQPINKIARRDIKQCLQACLKFPKRNIKPYKGKSIAELADMDVPEVDWLAPKSVDGYRKLLQGIFAYAKEQEYIQLSPAVDLNLDLKITKKKASFSTSEVIKLLNAALTLIDKNENRKWMVLLGAYTGARLGEIAQLRKVDFKVDADSNIKYLRITSDAGAVKTGSANRLVPIHSTLLDLGLEAFVAKVEGEGRVFPSEANYSKKITAWFPSFLKNLAIPKLNDLNQSLSISAQNFPPVSVQ